MAAIIGIISRRSLRIEVWHRNQPNKSKLALYRVPPLSLKKVCSFHFNGSLEQLYINNETECIVAVAYVNVHALRHSKEELAWAIDELLQVISNITLFITVISLRN